MTGYQCKGPLFATQEAADQFSLTLAADFRTELWLCNFMHWHVRKG